MKNYTTQEIEAMSMAIDQAVENVTTEYVQHNIELGYLDIDTDNNGHKVAVYMDMDGHEGYIFVDTLEPLTQEEINQLF